MGDVKIIDPSPLWQAEYRDLAEALRDALRDTAIRIDHVGSTAVKGLPAKDILDIQVTVATQDAIHDACDRLREQGYSVRADSYDHPVAEEDATDAWRKGFASEKPGQRPCHIHIRVVGRPNQTYALLFRDYLRAHQATALAYASFKKKAAALLPGDSARYADLKDPVCDLVYLPALVWAEATNWTPASD